MWDDPLVEDARVAAPLAVWALVEAVAATALLAAVDAADVLAVPVAALPQADSTSAANDVDAEPMRTRREIVAANVCSFP